MLNFVRFYRFLTGPADLTEVGLCEAQQPVPTIYYQHHMTPSNATEVNSRQRVHVVVYRALRLTICLFVKGWFVSLSVAIAKIYA